MTFNFSKVVVVSLINLVAFNALAWKDVGNAAGISEQNLVYAKGNAEDILSPLWAQLISDSAKADLRGFVAALRVKNLIFNSRESGRAFEVSGGNWTVNLQQLSVYDQDGNELLNQGEAFLILWDIYAFQNSFSKERSQDFRSILFNFIQSREKTLVLRSNLFEIQWTEYKTTSVISYVVFFPETEALHLSVRDFQEALCEGPVQKFRLFNPYALQAGKQSSEVVFLVRASADYECQGRKQQKTLLLEIVASPEKSLLKLKQFGLQD
ncbi:hypothetical protein D3C87_144750 [compost metagenome]